MRAQCDPTPRKGKIKLAFPDLSRFEFNTGNKYRINSSLWMDGLEFVAGRKEKGKDPVTDEGEVGVLPLDVSDPMMPPTEKEAKLGWELHPLIEREFPTNVADSEAIHKEMHSRLRNVWKSNPVLDTLDRYTHQYFCLFLGLSHQKDPGLHFLCIFLIIC